MTTKNIRSSQLNSSKEGESSQVGSHSDVSYQAWRNAVYECLIDANMTEDAQRWIDCESFHRVNYESNTLPEILPSKTTYILVCSQHPDEHPKIIQKRTCGLRYCPTCAEQHAARLVNRYAPLATQLATGSSRYRLRHIVLTTPFSLTDDNIEQRYKQHQQNIIKLFDKLLPKTWRKKQGLIVGDEFGEKTNYLHSHVLHFGQYIDQKKLSDTWLEVTNGKSKVTWIHGIEPTKEAIEKRTKEVLKYCTKFWRENEDGTRKMIGPELIPILARVLKGQRRVRTYGLFYNIPTPENHEEGCLCKECNAPMQKIWIKDYAIWRETGMTWTELEASYQDDQLHLKTANKSVLANAPPNNKPPPKQLKMTGFDANHYQQEDS